MKLSIQTATRVLRAPSHRLSVNAATWSAGIAELQRRGGGRRESGAFLLGHRIGIWRRVEQFVYYDDLDSRCLDEGIIRFRGSAYGRLWDVCAESRLEVVADVHTHPGRPIQSALDRDHPMIATKGHVALIVPFYAQRDVAPQALGIYEYVASHRWIDRSQAAQQFFFIEA